MSKQSKETDLDPAAKADWEHAKPLILKLAVHLQGLHEDELVNLTAQTLDVETVPDVIAHELRGKLKDLYFNAQLGSSDAMEHLAAIAVEITHFLERLLGSQTDGAKRYSQDSEFTSTFLPKSFALDACQRDYGWGPANSDRLTALATEIGDVAAPLHSLSREVLEKVLKCAQKISPPSLLVPESAFLPRPPKDHPNDGDTPESATERQLLVECILLRLMEIRLGSRAPAIAQKICTERLSWPILINYTDTLNKQTFTGLVQKIKDLKLAHSNPSRSIVKHWNIDSDTKLNFASWIYNHLLIEWKTEAAARDSGGQFWADRKSHWKAELKKELDHPCQHILRRDRIWQIQARLLPSPTKNHYSEWTDAGMLFLVSQQLHARHPLQEEACFNFLHEKSNCLTENKSPIEKLPSMGESNLFDPEDPKFKWPAFLTDASNRSNNAHRTFKGMVRLVLAEGLKNLLGS